MVMDYDDVKMKVQKTASSSIITWRIHNFVNGPLDICQPFESPEFVTRMNGPIRWRLAVKARNMVDGCYFTALYLHRSPDCTGPENVTVKFRMSVVDRTDTVWFERERKAGFRKNVMSLLASDLKFDDVIDSYGVVDSTGGTLKIRCEILFDVAKYIDDSDVDLELKRLSDDLKVFSRVNVVDDFNFRHGNDLIPGHRDFLEVRSPFISDLLKKNPCENRVDLSFEQKIQVKKLISYLYSGDLKELLSKPTFGMCNFISRMNQKELISYFKPQIVNVSTTFGAYCSTVKWKIDNFCQLEDSDCVESPVFHQVVPNEEMSWRFIFHPKGTSDDPDYVSVFAINLKTNILYPVHLEVSFVDDQGEPSESRSTLSWLHPTGYFGFRQFMELDKFQSMRDDLVVNNSLTLRFCIKFGTGAIVQEVDVIKNSAVSAATPWNTYKYLAKNLKKLLLSEARSNFSLVAFSREYRLHRSVLSARSDYFADMLVGYLASNGGSTIIAPNLDTETFEKCIRYMYYAEPIEMNAETSLKLYPFCLKYQISRLKDLSSEYLLNNMNPENVSGVIELADMLDDVEVKRAALRHMNDNWRKVVRTDGWKKLRNKKDDLVSEILAFPNSPSKTKRRKMEEF